MAEEQFDLIAQSRANYYTEGSPVQFVRVELLQGDVSGDIAVCLTFKNISDQPLKSLKIHYVCKSKAGAVVAEDDFSYTHLNAKNGELFGMDDAVALLEEKVGNVEVTMLSAKVGRERLRLGDCRRVRLPLPKKLEPELRTELERKVGVSKLKYYIQEVPQGWYCACGAFHPKEEDGVYCSECGGNRILWQEAIAQLEQKRQTVVPAAEKPAAKAAAEQPPAQEAVAVEQPPVQELEPSVSQKTIVAPQHLAAQEDFFADIKAKTEASEQKHITRPFSLQEELLDDLPVRESFEPVEFAVGELEAAPLGGDQLGVDSAAFMPSAVSPNAAGDALARKVIRLLPPITAGACVAVVLIGVLVVKILG